MVKSGEGQVDLVSELNPLDTLRVAQSPFAKVVKSRGVLMTIFGFLNMLKTDSPWRDVRMRQAVNYAINREDLVRYAAKGNGVIIPALIPPQGFGYNPDLAPYPFDPEKARRLMREAGYPHGLAITLLASEELTVQATVVGKMLEQVGFEVDFQILDAVAHSRKLGISTLDQPAEQQGWDIAIVTVFDNVNFPALEPYLSVTLDGTLDWVLEKPELRQLHAQVINTLDREKQRALIMAPATPTDDVPGSST